MGGLLTGLFVQGVTRLRPAKNPAHSLYILRVPGGVAIGWAVALWVWGGGGFGIGGKRARASARAHAQPRRQQEWPC